MNGNNLLKGKNLNMMYITYILFSYQYIFVYVVIIFHIQNEQFSKSI